MPTEAAVESVSQSFSRPASGYLLLSDGSPASPLSQRVHAAFRALVLDPEFPCVGARSALNQDSYRFGMYPELGSSDTTTSLAQDLHLFLADEPSLPGDFSTFIACFDAPKVIDPLTFESLLWRQLEVLHEVDVEPWDASVSSDPSSPRFSFSFGGRAFFVVGLSPAGARWGRTFPWPVLVFNPHDQFERLRKTGQFDRIQEVIRDRDAELEGDINPNLANFGEHTEARQYSGRPVEGGWRCPVSFEKR